MISRDAVYLYPFIQRLHNRRRLLLPIFLLLLAGLACNFPKMRAPEKALHGKGDTTGQGLTDTGANVAAIAATVTSYEGEAKLVLHWSGPLPGDPFPCHTLEVSADYQARYGRCDSELQVTQFNHPQWDELLLRNAPFDLSTSEATINFKGQGNMSGPAWERAVLHWVEDAYASLYTGHACAACNTVFNWSFGEVQAGIGGENCQSLWVTDYGYAYLGVTPCQGGQAVIEAQGWLETGEWAQLDAWLSGRAEVSLGETGASYLLGSGSQPMSNDEITQLAAWAQQVRNRLLEANP